MKTKLFIFIGIYTVLAFYILPGQNICDIELISSIYSKKSWQDLIFVRFSSGYFPLYFLLAKIWVKSFGSSCFLLYMLHILIGATGIPLIYYLGRELGLGQKAWWGSLWWALLPGFLHYTQIVHPHIGLIVVGFFFFLLLLKTLKHPSRAKFLFLGVSGIVGCLWSPLLLLYLLGIALFSFILSQTSLAGANVGVIACLTIINLWASYDFKKACESIGFCDHSAQLINEKPIWKKKSYINIIENSKSGDRFILKQSKRSTMSEQFGIIFEALGSHLAQFLKIPTQKVILVPKREISGVKKYGQLPASLHTFVPGVIVRNSPYRKIDIKQYTEPPVSEEEWGLRMKVIKSMAVHPQLPRIVALDTFVGMNDRSGSNYFYDNETGVFWVIDMADSFKENLCKHACLQIKKMMDNQVLVFSEKEWNSLIDYRHHLQLLVNEFPPEKLIPLFEEYLEQTNFPYSPNAITTQKQFFIESYADAQILIALLDELVNRNERN